MPFHVTTDFGMVPLLVFNETHFVILYIPFDDEAADSTLLVFADMYEMTAIGKPKYVKRFAFRIRITEETTYVAYASMLHGHLSSLGYLSVSFQSTVYIIDTTGGDEVICITLAMENLQNIEMQTRARLESKPSVEELEARVGELRAALDLSVAVAENNRRMTRMFELEQRLETEALTRAERKEMKKEMKDIESKLMKNFDVKLSGTVEELEQEWKKQKSELDDVKTLHETLASLQDVMPKCRRIITHVNITHGLHNNRESVPSTDAKELFLDRKVPVTGYLTIGTQVGDCYILDWFKERKVVIADTTSAVEPVFSSVYKNGRHLIHAVMSVIGYMGEGSGVSVRVPCDRPLSIGACGSLLFMNSKYGHTKIISLAGDEKLRFIDPPDKGSVINIFQHAYPSMCVRRDHIVIVYPSGLVERITPVLKKK
jgi:hypothetical protein